MGLKSRGLKGDQGNRISSANALSSYVMYKYKNKGFTFTPGLRFESIKFQRRDYGKSNSKRDKSNLSNRENDVSVLIPGIGLNYTLNRNFSVFGGFIKDFLPPEIPQDRDPRIALILKWGLDFLLKKLEENLYYIRMIMKIFLEVI